MELKRFSPQNIDNVMDKVKQALSTVEDEFGIKIEFGSERYNTLEFGTKMTVKVRAGKDDNALAKAEWDRNVRSYKYQGTLTPEMYGATFQYKGKLGLQKYKIVSISTKSRKYPVICEREYDKQLVKFTLFAIKNATLNYPQIDLTAGLNFIPGKA